MSNIDELELYKQLTRERLRYEAESKDPYKAIDDLIENVIFLELSRRDTEKSLQLANGEITRLIDLVNRDGWAPLNMIAGGPGSPGYDDEPYTYQETLSKYDDLPVIEEWRLPEKDR